MRSRIPDMNDKQLEKMVFLERCLHCLHVVGERIEVRVWAGWVPALQLLRTR